MGIALYGNEDAWADTFSTTGFTNGANLRTDNLSPGATMTASEGVITIAWPTTLGTPDRAVDAVLVAGVFASDTVNGVEIPANVDNNRISLYLEIDEGAGYSEVVTDDVIRVRQTPFSKQHYIIILPRRYNPENLRLTINKTLSADLRVGVVRAMKMLDDDTLFAKQGAFTPSDSAQTIFSQGGQAFSGAGQVRREINVQHGQMPDWVLHGGIPNPVEIDLPAPSNGGGVTITADEIEVTTAGTSGTFFYSGESWVVDTVYEVRARAWIEGSAGNAVFSPSIGNDIPFANSFRRFKNTVGTVSMSFTIGGDTGQTTHVDRDLRIFTEGQDQDKALRFIGNGWGDVIGSTEGGKPIMVVESDNPEEQGFTGYWGVVTRWGDYRRSGGSLSTGMFTLTELL